MAHLALVSSLDFPLSGLACYDLGGAQVLNQSSKENWPTETKRDNSSIRPCFILGPHEANSLELFIKIFHSQAANRQDLFSKEDVSIYKVQNGAAQRKMNGAPHPSVTGYWLRFLEYELFRDIRVGADVTLTVN